MKFLDNGSYLEHERIQSRANQANSTDLVCLFKQLRLFVEVWQHDIGPIPEDQQIDEHRQAHAKVVKSVPVPGMTVDHNLHALQSKDVHVVAFTQCINEVETLVCRSKDVGKVQILKVHR